MTQPASTYQYKTSRYGSHHRLLQALPPHGEGAPVVDVGGGEGYLANALSSRGFRVCCLAKPNSVAHDMSSSVRIVEVDLNCSQPDMTDRFAYAVCGDVLEHLVDPLGFLIWLRRHLEPNGKLVASLPNSAHFFVRLNVLLGRFPQHERGLFDRTHLHFFAWRNWAALLDDAGFTVESVNPTVIPFGLIWPRLAEGPIVKALEGTNYWLARFFDTFWAYQFVVVARPHNADE